MLKKLTVNEAVITLRIGHRYVISFSQDRERFNRYPQLTYTGSIVGKLQMVWPQLFLLWPYQSVNLHCQLYDSGTSRVETVARCCFSSETTRSKNFQDLGQYCQILYSCHFFLSYTPVPTDKPALLYWKTLRYSNVRSVWQFAEANFCKLPEIWPLGFPIFKENVAFRGYEIVWSMTGC